MEVVGLFVVAILFFAILSTFTFVVSKLKRIGNWSQTYRRLAKRYGAKSKDFRNNAMDLAIALGFKKPSLYFNYGRTFCRLRNLNRPEFSTGRSTEMLMNWPDRKLKLIVSTSPNQPSGRLGLYKQVFIDQPKFQSDFYVSSNRPEVAKRMLNSGIQWQIEQLRRHLRDWEVLITIDRGKLLIAKPGYIKEHQELKDFVRLGLNLFDQLMLVDVKGISFVNENQASIVVDVKCPICSEEIMHDMVVCNGCKTPHCRDCWQYNGQCATFACGEKRFLSPQEVRV